MTLTSSHDNCGLYLNARTGYLNEADADDNIIRQTIIRILGSIFRVQTPTRIAGRESVAWKTKIIQKCANSAKFFPTIIIFFSF